MLQTKAYNCQFHSYNTESFFSSLIESVEHNRVFKYWENNQLKQVVRETSRMTGSRPSAQWDTQPGHALFLKAAYRLQEDCRIWGAGEKLLLGHKTLQRNTSTGKGGCLWGTGTDKLWGWDETPEQASREGQVAGLVCAEICPRRLFQVKAFAWKYGSVSLWAQVRSRVGVSSRLEHQHLHPTKGCMNGASGWRKTLPFWGVVQEPINSLQFWFSASSKS